MERMRLFTGGRIGVTKAARVNEPALSRDSHGEPGNPARINVRLETGSKRVQPRSRQAAVAHPNGAVVSFGSIVVGIDDHRTVAHVVSVEVLGFEGLRGHAVISPAFAVAKILAPDAGEIFDAANAGAIDAHKAVTGTAKRIESSLVFSASLVVTIFHDWHETRGPNSGVLRDAVDRESAHIG